MISIAWFALFSWPVAAYVFYRNLSPAVALIATVLGGYLLLPSGLWLDLPLLPILDKINVATLAALAMTALIVRRHPEVLQRWIPRSPVVLVLTSLLVLGAFGSALTNTEPIFLGNRMLPGHTIYDGFSISLGLMVSLVPFFLARMLLSSAQSHRTLLKAIVLSACAYSFLALWEVRMSPQLHTQLYGYFPHVFYQQMRGDGFRPVVFMPHGLAMALFFSFATIAAAVLMQCSKADKEARLLWMYAMVWLFGVLVLCKSLGALVIALVIVPLVLFCSTRIQLLFAVCVAATVLSYPVLRASNLIPLNQILEISASIDPERAASLGVRVSNEDALLEKALQKPVFGWGIWGRSRIYNKHGHDVSITDGTWVIELGQGGLVRYISLLGFLCLPIILFFSKCRTSADPASVGVVLLLSAKLIDIIPNSGIGPIAFMCAGALVGYLEMSFLAKKGVSQSALRDGYPDRRPEQRYARDFSEPADPTNEEVQPPASHPRKNPRSESKYSRMKTTRGYRV